MKNIISCNKKEIIYDSLEFDKKNDDTPILNSIPVAPDKAAQQERFNKKNRKKNKNKNRNFNDCSNY